MWWMKPSQFVAFVLLPIFLICVYLPSDLVIQTGARVYCITDEIRLLGAACLGAFAVGAWLTEAGGKWRSENWSEADILNSISSNRLFTFFVASAILSIVGYMLLFLPVIGNFGGYMKALGGSFAEQNSLKGEIRGAAAGGSSLMSMQSIAGAIWAVGDIADRRRFRGVFPLLLIGVVAILCFLRVILVSERLALVEFGFPIAIIWMMGDPKRRFIYKLFPIIAIFVLVIFFGVFEYFRMWKVAQTTGVSFPEFCLNRLTAYYVTAINNGSLLYTYGTPDHLFRHAFPGIFDFAAFRGTPYSNDAWRIEYFHFLKAYLSLAFNNPSGIFPILLDFGPVGGVLVFFGLGLAIGAVAKSFGLRTWPGLVTYPVVFIGIWELIREFYWGDGRFLVPFVMCVALSAFGARARPAFNESKSMLGGRLRSGKL